MNTDHYIGPEVSITSSLEAYSPLLIHSAQIFSARLPNHSASALQQWQACFAGLRAVRVGGVGNIYSTSKSLWHPVWITLERECCSSCFPYVITPIKSNIQCWVCGEILIFNMLGTGSDWPQHLCSHHCMHKKHNAPHCKIRVFATMFSTCWLQYVKAKQLIFIEIKQRLIVYNIMFTTYLIWNNTIFLWLIKQSTSETIRLVAWNKNVMPGEVLSLMSLCRDYCIITANKLHCKKHWRLYGIEAKNL